MKRKVRIYKDPNGIGGYINKTAQWLRKAQEGIQTGVTPVTQGIMQQMQTSQPRQAMQQPNQDPQEQILQTVVALAQQGYGQDEIKDYLLQNVYGFDKNSQEYVQYEPQVLDFVSAVFERSGSEEEEDDQTYAANVPTMEETDTENVAENNNYGDEELMNDILFDDDEEEDQEARYGGVPNKRSYINKLVRKLKKAAEGDQVEEANTANVRGTEDNPTGTTGNKNIFVEGVKGQAENYFIKEQAKQMYNNKFGQGMPQSQNDMDYAQFGGMRMRRANRKMFGTPFAPMGVTSSKYSFGPFGGLRSADVQFNPMMLAQMFPMMSFPGMGGMSSWGYNEPYKKRSAGRLVTEKIASALNNKAITDVANSTGSTAANTTGTGPCTEDEVKDPNNKRCYDPMYAGHGPVVNNEETTVTNTENTGVEDTNAGGSKAIDGAKQAMELKNVKDKWGRSKGARWYGFDPDTKEWTKGKPDWKIEEEKKTLKKDKWGRPETSQWYGFDPKTKKYTIGKDKGLTAKERETRNIKEMQNSPEVKKLREFYSKPQAAQADDELITELVTMGAGSLTNKGLKNVGQEVIDFGFKNPNLLGQGSKGVLGAGQKLLNPGQKLLNPGQKLLNPGQGLLEAPAGTQLVLPFPNLAFGGPVNNPMQDQFGNLQKFVYGDQVDDQMLEDLYQPPINQSDLDYSDSKDVTDAYFMHGGLHKAYDGYSMQGFNPSMFGNYGDFGTTGYNYGFRGTPMYGLGSYGTGLLGAGARLIGSLASGRRRGYMPNMNPMQYAATAAGITKSGMLPTGISYTKEKSKGLLGNLGLKYDRNMTINYATPEQIKAGVTNANLSTKPTTPAINVNDKSKTTNEFGLNKKLNFPDDNNRFKLSDARINAADRRSNRQENRMMNRDLRTGDILKFTGPDMSNMQDMEMPANTVDSYKAGTDPKLGFAFGGYIPDYMSYDDYIPMADQGINFSSISYNPNSIVQPGGIGQGKTGPCTEEEVKDPNSPCYDPIYAGQGPRSKDQSQETASLTYKEVKEPMSAERAANRLGLGIDFSNILADEKDALNEYKYKKIPGMTEVAMGEKFAAGEPLNRGMWGRDGKEGDPQSFKGVIKKGGAIKSKKSNASGHKIDINDFQSLLKLAGLI